LLQTVAVIREEFSFRLAAEVARIRELERMLADLQTAEFIYEQPTAVDVEYTFKHALTQQVAYEAILHERRKVLHERDGTAIERLDADRLEERYSDTRHFAKSANSAEAIEYLVRAGDAAAAKFGCGKRSHAGRTRYVCSKPKAAIQCGARTSWCAPRF
jgi:predicted ATPase